MNPAAIVGRRIHTDFLMRSRLGAYRALLERALAAGYAIVSIERWWSMVAEGDAPAGPRHLILRHDVDTDPGTARAMWRIERELGIESSYFFRLSTLDPGLMAAIAQGGGRASYHYEELATVARRRRPRDRAAALELIPEARDLFATNLADLRRRSGLALDVVASHGDFLNRRLDVKNTLILADPPFRQAMGIRLETYDEAFLDTVASYHRDLPPPACWMPGAPEAAIERGASPMYLLVHPRPWRVDRPGNALDDLARLRDELAYRLPIPSSGSTRR